MNESKNLADIESEQAAVVRRMLGHYETEPKFLAMMLPEFVQYQLASSQIDYQKVASLEDEFNKETGIGSFFNELIALIKKYFSKFFDEESFGC